jgi:hypothetical protein
MAAAKKQTKKDLENKIAKLEAKLNQLSEQIASKSAKTKPAEVKIAKPKPAETAKPKPTLPKGSTPKPQEAPKPAETASATFQDALENAYMNAAMTDLHQYRAKVTGYTPAPNRYFVRGTAPVGKIPTKNWNDQKATVTGYTQPSEQYFATRPRLAYHPAEKRFGSFSGVAMTVQGVALKATAQEAPKPQVSEQAPPPQTAPSNDDKSKQDKLSDYESDYLKRLEQQKIDDAKAVVEAAAAESQAKVSANTKGGALPKGFEAKAEPEPAKSSKGTLPKGF